MSCIFRKKQNFNSDIETEGVFAGSYASPPANVLYSRLDKIIINYLISI
jgi:hypothetical protein